MDKDNFNLSEKKYLNLKDNERKSNATYFGSTLNKLQNGKRIFENIFYEVIELTDLTNSKEIKKDKKYPYALNISMLRCLIELFLYEVLPEKKVDPAAKIAIYVATRVQKHNKQGAETENYRFGREYREDNVKEYRTYYIGSNTPHTLMEEVFHLHSDEESDTKVHRLLGVQLISRKKMKPQWEFVKVKRGLSGEVLEEEYRTIKHSKEVEKEIEKFCEIYSGEELKISPLPRPLHYIADIAVSAVEEISKHKPKFQEIYDKSLPKFINASRLLDQKKYLEALKEIINEKEWPDETQINMKGRYYILQRLRSVACPEISNENFYHLVSIYAAESKSKSGNSTTS